METDEAQMSKRTRMANGGGGGGGGYEAAARKEQQDEDEEDGEGGGGGKAAATPVRFLAWQQQLQLQHQHQQLSHASRICRVSRASGGKDRHSKVFTAKGLRDRRVRLSVPTAIQFYDLQDRLGYDQPSKAVEWLIKSASAAISELPSLDAAFAQMSGPLTDTKYIAGGDGGASERGVENHGSSQQHQHMSLTKSACSSNSDTSKGSVLSLSRSESRVKARERAKERATTKEKDKGGQENGDNNNNHDSPPVPSHHQTAGLNSHSSFTELLTFGVAGGAGGGGGSSHTQSPLGILQAYSSGEGGPTAAVHKQIRQLHPTATTADYFNQSHSNPFTHDQKPNLHHHQPQGFTAMPHFTTNTPTIGMLPFSVTTAVASAAANGGGGSSDHHNHHHHHHHEIHQQYPFLQDHHLIPTAVTSGGGDFGSNLSFSISSGLAGFNRGTLQSNSTNGSSAAPHLQQHLQRLSASQELRPQGEGEELMPLEVVLLLLPLPYFLCRKCVTLKTNACSCASHWPFHYLFTQFMFCTCPAIEAVTDLDLNASSCTIHVFRTVSQLNRWLPAVLSFGFPKCIFAYNAIAPCQISTINCFHV